MDKEKLGIALVVNGRRYIWKLSSDELAKVRTDKIYGKMVYEKAVAYITNNIRVEPSASQGEGPTNEILKSNFTAQQEKNASTSNNTAAQSGRNASPSSNTAAQSRRSASPFSNTAAQSRRSASPFSNTADQSRRSASPFSNTAAQSRRSASSSSHMAAQSGRNSSTSRNTAAQSRGSASSSSNTAGQSGRNGSTSRNRAVQNERNASRSSSTAAQSRRNEREVDYGNEENYHDDADIPEDDNPSFTHERILLLLATYSKFQDKIENGRQKKHQVWRMIAAEMSKKGFSAVTGRMCEVKFKNMKTTYKTIKMRQQQSGSGGESRWPYFQKMHDLLRNDVAVNPDNIVEAGASGFNRIRRRAYFQRQHDSEEEDRRSPTRKRKRISNAETLEMMMEAEAERSQVNNQMLEILNGFRQQGETKLKLMKKLVAEKESNETD